MPTPNVYGLECENAIDNDTTTHWYPASSWQQQDFDNDGKLSYADHATDQYKRGQQPVYTLLLGKYIGLKQIILRQFNFAHGFASKVR